MSFDRTDQSIALATESDTFESDTLAAGKSDETSILSPRTKYALRDAPLWLQETITKLKNLATLQENWDSYGGLPVDRRSIDNAILLITNLASVENVSEPAIGATPDGEAGLSWDGGHWSLDADILPDGRIDYVYTDDRDPSCDVEETTSNPYDLLSLLTAWE